ncbi:TPA: tyrosine-type recombinase/integrase [Yersinia enterocolitica]|nr:tyrosine-type recombinase/integrase [Yersinia enterocolitica]
MNLVDAVKTSEQCEQVGELLLKHGNQTYADIWNFGLQVALRISDLLFLTYADVQGDRLVIIEGKTSKPRHIVLNDKAKAIVKRRKADNPTHVYLFEVSTNRAKGKPISRENVSRKFKEIGEIIGIALGTHSMRKTRGWVMYNSGINIETIAKVLNHSSPAITMRYIGLDQQTVDSTYTTFII